jgi:cold shock protein
VVTGRVVKFDGARGYGFIAPDHGGEDVFLHVNDMAIPEHMVRSGLAVVFDVEEGDRGPKASRVRLAEGAGLVAAPHVMGVPSVVNAPSAGPHEVDDESLCDVLDADEYLREVTEILLNRVPSLTGDQIVQIRTGLLQFAKNRGWAEG